MLILYIGKQLVELFGYDILDMHIPYLPVGI